MIEFDCSHCGHQIKAQMAAAGIASKCPRCKANTPELITLSIQAAIWNHGIGMER